MIDGYPYTAILVTGILHGILGAAACLIGVVGVFSARRARIFRTYSIVVILMANLVLLVGSLGVIAGRRKLSDTKLRRYKIAYMVMAILSACIFSLVGLGIFCSMLVVSTHVQKEWEIFITLGQVGSVVMALEFVLAIVSSSICCCCANPNANTTVIIQAPAGEAYTAVQYQQQSTYQQGAPI